MGKGYERDIGRMEKGKYRERMTKRGGI